MKILNNNVKAVKAFLSLIIFIFSGWLSETYASTGCAPCGEIITNIPYPTYEANGVQPFQNYIATYVSCPKAGISGFYFGTGFGYGSINYNLKVPGIVLKNFTNSYITEYVTIGYSHTACNFFIAGELGYYYNSVTSPLFYEDHSFFEITFTDVATGTVNIEPCGVRLDINAQNHVALDLLPGFAVGPRLNLFGRLGLEYTSYSWHRRLCIPQTRVLTNAGQIVLVDANQFFNLMDDFSDINDDQTDQVIDYRLGVGASYAAGPHLRFTVNYVHIFGSSVTFAPDRAQINIGSTIIADEATPMVPLDFSVDEQTNTLLAHNTINPSRNEILFGLTVTF